MPARNHRQCSQSFPLLSLPTLRLGESESNYSWIHESNPQASARPLQPLAYWRVRKVRDVSRRWRFPSSLTAMLDAAPVHQQKGSLMIMFSPNALWLPWRRASLCRCISWGSNRAGSVGSTVPLSPFRHVSLHWSSMRPRQNSPGKGPFSRDSHLLGIWHCRLDLTLTAGSRQHFRLA